MKARILEIFRSVQGEGKYAGVPQVFVRFYKCNIHCHWCDTPHSIGDNTANIPQAAKEYSIEDACRSIRSLLEGVHSISFTGGEPLLQSTFISELVKTLKPTPVRMFLETNGIYYKELKEIIDGIDIVSMDLKLPSSTRCAPFWEEHKKFLQVARKKDVYVKAVITSDTQREDFAKAIELVSGIDPQILFIVQPNSFELSNGVMKRCLEFQDMAAGRLRDVRILPQVHRFMKLR